MQPMTKINEGSPLAKEFDSEYKALTDSYIKGVLAQNEKLWVACTKILTNPNHYIGITIGKKDYLKSAETLINTIEMSAKEYLQRIIMLDEMTTGHISLPIPHLTEAARMELFNITGVFKSFHLSFSMLYDRYSGVYAGATNENRAKENRERSKFDQIVSEIYDAENYTEWSADETRYLVSFLELSSENNDIRIAIFSNLFQGKNLIHPLRHLTKEGRQIIENILIEP